MKELSLKGTEKGGFIIVFHFYKINCQIINNFITDCIEIKIEIPLYGKN